MKASLKCLQERMERENTETTNTNRSFNMFNCKGTERNNDNWSMKLGQKRVLSILDERNKYMFSC